MACLDVSKNLQNQNNNNINNNDNRVGFHFSSDCALIARDSDQILHGRLIPTGSRNRFTATDNRQTGQAMSQQRTLVGGF